MAQLRAIVDLPASSRSAATARALVCAILPAWGLAPIAEDAALVVSEMVANAVQHAPGSASHELEIVRRSRGVRIYISDGSPAVPVVAELSHSRPHGRGMRVIEELSSSWGSDEHHGGKRVWVDLDVQ
ncbi:MAG: hypothetical protein QOG07_2576 [Pseudonocardiales bacterium]|nr:hypothetical protein [Pseudonocardiales bacterium]